MKITRRQLLRLIKENLGPDEPERMGGGDISDPSEKFTASHREMFPRGSRKGSLESIIDRLVDMPTELLSKTDDLIYAHMASIAGLKKISKMKDYAPLALRGLAKFYAEDRSTFTEADLTDLEKNVLIDIIKTQLIDPYMNHFESGKKGMPKHYSGYFIEPTEGNFITQGTPGERVADLILNAASDRIRLLQYYDYGKYIGEDMTAGLLPDVGPSDFWGRDKKAVCRNLERFLGQANLSFKFLENDASKGVEVEVIDKYDFNSSKINFQAKTIQGLVQVDQPADTGKKWPKSLVPVITFLQILAGGLRGDSYSGIRVAAGLVQNAGIKGYPIRIKLKF